MVVFLNELREMRKEKTSKSKSHFASLAVTPDFFCFPFWKFPSKV